jgi:hypothetical protein
LTAVTGAGRRNRISPHTRDRLAGVLTPSGVLIDVRPVTAPIVVEVVIAAQAVWATTVDSYSAPEDVGLADAAVRHAVSRERLVLGAKTARKRRKTGEEYVTPASALAKFDQKEFVERSAWASETATPS